MYQFIVIYLTIKEYVFILGTTSSFKNVYEQPIMLSRQPAATPAVKGLGHSRADELSKLTDSFILRRTQDTIAKYLPPKSEKLFA